MTIFQFFLFHLLYDLIDDVLARILQEFNVIRKAELLEKKRKKELYDKTIEKEFQNKES